MPELAHRPSSPKGQEVHLTLTLHCGNEDNLKNFEAASGFLAELVARHKETFDPTNLVLVSAGDFAAKQTTQSPAVQ